MRVAWQRARWPKQWCASAHYVHRDWYLLSHGQGALPIEDEREDTPPPVLALELEDISSVYLPTCATVSVVTSTSSLDVNVEVRKDEANGVRAYSFISFCAHLGVDVQVNMPKSSA